jgi:cytosine/adenosine deaminase-related metal-dependent hydrolase
VLIRVSHCLPTYNQYFSDCGIEITGETISKIGRWDDHFVNREPDVSFTDAVAVPGLINAHCHLDFSNLKNMLPAQTPFAEWIGKLVNIGRTGTAPKFTEADYQKNVVDQIATGTTAIFDVSVTGMAPATPIQVIPFFEMVGFRLEQVEQRTGLMKTHLEKFKDHRPVGISPHTPYTTLKNYFDFAYQNADYVMTHVAESEFENEFMENRSGSICW